jgi:nucleotide-binding universal stress UspA family protein
VQPSTRQKRLVSRSTRSSWEDEHRYHAIIGTADRKAAISSSWPHGRHGISALVLGSETVKVLTHSKIPVLVHR